MKTLILLLLMTGLAQADVFVVTAPDNSVYSLSEQDDAVVPAGYVKTILKNKKISDLNAAGNEKMYDFNKGTFTLDATKVQAKNKSDTDAILAAQKVTNDKASGIAKMKTVVGLTDDEIKVLLK